MREIRKGDLVDVYSILFTNMVRKAYVMRIKKGMFGHTYYVRYLDGDTIEYAKKERFLSLAEDDSTIPKITFSVYPKRNGTVCGIPIERNASYSAIKKSNGYYMVNIEGKAIDFTSHSLEANFHTEEQRQKEDKDMSYYAGALHGYPPEEDVPSTKYDVIAEREYEERIAVLERGLSEKDKQFEAVRREKVAEEYGIVVERHLWSVTVDVPMQWSGPIPKRGCEEKTEVLTEGRNMVEAAMAAEAMAKGIAENAHVLSIDYVRVIGALK